MKDNLCERIPFKKIGSQKTSMSYSLLHFEMLGEIPIGNRRTIAEDNIECIYLSPMNSTAIQDILVI